ncbi:P27 family phage terminase small subunit [Campylobacter estrildidarum]|uniref:Terminase n=1 Tax=Campylobacter estrildidarum TaxID=2510189 RepID=A0A4U7BG48_9BACT|nr:P27 family phage terminase small subunit [Campylobacter estrildidarum]TKX30663.1 terminase [Campylobacter estrildidarum]
MLKEFLNIDEVLQILNIKSKEYLSRYLKKNGVKVFKGKAKPYPKDEILRLAKKRQEENHHNSKQNKVILYIDDNTIKEKSKQTKKAQEQTTPQKELNLSDIEQELTQKTINELENLGIYDPLENDIIKVYAKNLILFECSSKEIENKGFYVTSDKGTPIISPEFTAFNSLTKNIIGLAKNLGIGAPNRVRVNPKENKQNSTFDILLNETENE